MGLDLGNLSVSELAVTTWNSRRKTIADGITNNNALLKRLQTKKFILPFDGGEYMSEPLFYSENDTVGSYSGYQTLDIAPQQVITEARYNLKQAAVTISMSGREEITNSGEARFLNLWSTRMENAKQSLYNLVGTQCYGDGSTFNGNALGGLDLIISKTPNSGTVGGIDASRASVARVWRNIAYSASANGYTVNATTILQLMHNVFNQLVRGQEAPDLITMDSNYFGYFQTALEGRQRVADASTGDLADFRGLRFLNADVVLDGGLLGACPANTAYFINSSYIKLRVHPARNFVAGKTRESINQDAWVTPIWFAGEMTTNLRRLHGVLFN